MFILNFFKKIGYGIKNGILAIIPRLKPRPTFGWIFSAVLWLIVLAYIGFGVYFGIQVYTKHSESNSTKFAVKIYPFPAAIVNGGVVWTKDYYQQLTYIRQFSSKTKQPFPDAGGIRQQIVEQLIENKLLQLQATRYHVTVTSKDVNDAYQKIVDQSGGTSEVKKVLNELYGMTEKQFKELVRQQVLKEKIQNELIVQVKVGHILIKDEAKANDVAARVKKGEDFAALAKQYSEDTKSRDNGGELGYLSRGQLVIDSNPIPEFDEAAFKASVGDIIGPVKTSIGFDILKIEDRKGTVDQNYNTWVASLKKQAKIWRLIR